MINKLIAISDGHGVDSPGKRTPAFKDGTVMKENDFNWPVSQKLAAALQRCGFKTLFVAPELTNTPLATRTKRSDEAKANMYISIHANALKGVWGDWGGIETFYCPGSVEGEKLARLIHAEIMKGTPLRNRGYKAINFQELREPKAVSALVELGFMDNLEEAQLLRTDEYRTECAEEICRGICRYYEVEYVEPKKEVVKEEVVAPDGKYYRVQLGAFKHKASAEELVAKMKAMGIEAVIKLN